MPASHGNKKHPHHSKKSRSIERRKATSQGNVPVDMPVSTAEVAVKKQNTAPATAPQTRNVRPTTYPYLISELKRIGIIAGVIIVVLVILAIILT